MSDTSNGQRHSSHYSATSVLVNTKRLVETLTRWAKGTSSAADVSDAYVQLGNVFKLACRSFQQAGVDITNIGDIPRDLRVILQAAIYEEQSQQTLDKYLPDIRKIITNLITKLKEKQQQMREIEESKNLGRNLSAHSSQRSVSGPPVSKAYSQRSSSSVDNSPQSKDPLAKLQKEESLKRRASRRFSAYQYAKLANFVPEREYPVPNPTGPKSPYQELSNPNSAARSLSKSPESVKSSSRFAPSNAPALTSEEGQTNSSSGSKFSHAIDGEKIHVYLKLHEETKKATISIPTSLTSLRLLFIQKFSYSPGTEAFPDIYIVDPKVNVRYELEESYLGDIQEGTILSLNVPDPTTILIKGLEAQLSSLKLQVSEVQTNVLSEVKDIVATNNKNPSNSATVDSSNSKTVVNGAALNNADLDELVSIRQDLSKAKQVYSDNKNNFTKTVHSLLEKLQQFQSANVSSSHSANRTIMINSQERLSVECETLLTKTDDLQDIIEGLRKDVSTRRARPSKKNLQYVSKEIEEAKADLKKVSEYISNEKETWKKIWESELNTVCEEQKFLNLQEELVEDLDEDLARAYETFSLVEECCEQLEKTPASKITPNLPIPEPGDNLNNVRTALLSEVELLQPDHQNRVEAIERAERLREKQKQLTMVNEFQEELGGFVEGQKLKKSGGIEETEKIRKLKDEQNLKGNYGYL
ncbi:BA75_02812T0 [Komagataella pastoris]|uniref:BA75_02812T0 n=1 Tax=Komagataella pastoris TaxID=4922 RepID=A0A1B2JAM0_PICPA|nr:BA75_02812T0 [Komagataella pastoris]